MWIGDPGTTFHPAAGGLLSPRPAMMIVLFIVLIRNKLRNDEGDLWLMFSRSALRTGYHHGAMQPRQFGGEMPLIR